MTVSQLVALDKLAINAWATRNHFLRFRVALEALRVELAVGPADPGDDDRLAALENLIDSASESFAHVVLDVRAIRAAAILRSATIKAGEGVKLPSGVDRVEIESDDFNVAEVVARLRGEFRWGWTEPAG